MRVFECVLAALILLVTAGCDESVDARVETDFGVTAYGFFDPGADTQAVRIYTIDPTLAPAGPEPLGVRVTSTDLTTGQMVEWRDSVVHFIGGSVGHVYWAPFTAEFDHRYRFEAELPGKLKAFTEATVPSPAEPVLRRDIANEYPRQAVHWTPAPRLTGLKVIYRFSNFRDVEFSYQGKQRRLEDGWVVEIDVRVDADRIREIMLQEIGVTVKATLLNVDVFAIVANEEWFPPGGGAFDPEVLVEPGTFTNMTNGFGFVGAGFRTALRWKPSDDTIQLIGFTPEDD